MSRRLNSILAAALVVAFGATSAFAQAGKPQQKPQPNPSAGDASKAEKATPIFLGNTTDPVDGKAVSEQHDKFVELEDGERIYVSSDANKETVKKDSKNLLAKAYGNPQPLASKGGGCAVCGKTAAAGAGKEVIFQGKKVTVCSDACVPMFKKNPNLFIAKLLYPDAKDAANATDPIDSKPVDPAIMAVYKKRIFHFSTSKNLAEFIKDPEVVAAKVKS